MTEPYLIAINRKDLHDGRELTDEEWMKVKKMLGKRGNGFHREIFDIVDEFANLVLKEREEPTDD